MQDYSNVPVVYIDRYTKKVVDIPPQFQMTPPIPSYFDNFDIQSLSCTVEIDTDVLKSFISPSSLNIPDENTHKKNKKKKTNSKNVL